MDTLKLPPGFTTWLSFYRFILGNSNIKEQLERMRCYDHEIHYKANVAIDEEDDNVYYRYFHYQLKHMVLMELLAIIPDKAVLEDMIIYQKRLHMQTYSVGDFRILDFLKRFLDAQ